MTDGPYSALTDGELIAFGKKKGPWLGDKAFALLQAEFIKRNLDDSVILAKEEKAASAFATRGRKPRRFDIEAPLTPEVLPDLIAQQRKNARNGALLLVAGLVLLTLAYIWPLLAVPFFGPIIFGACRLYNAAKLKKKYTALQQKWSGQDDFVN